MARSQDWNKLNMIHGVGRFEVDEYVVNDYGIEENMLNLSLTFKLVCKDVAVVRQNIFVPSGQDFVCFTNVNRYDNEGEEMSTGMNVPVMLKKRGFSGLLIRQIVDDEYLNFYEPFDNLMDYVDGLTLWGPFVVDGNDHQVLRLFSNDADLVSMSSQFKTHAKRKKLI